MFWLILKINENSKRRNIGSPNQSIITYNSKVGLILLFPLNQVLMISLSSFIMF